MGSSISFPLEYPINQLAVFADPATYFPFLPRDVREYMLKPYLLSSVPDEPIEGTWRHPQLVWTYVPELPFRVTDFFILPGGDLVVLVTINKPGRSTQTSPKKNYLYRISPLNHHRPMKLYNGKLGLITDLKYIVKEDFLYLAINDTEKYHVSAFSHLQAMMTPKKNVKKYHAKPSVMASSTKKLGRHEIKFGRGPGTQVNFYEWPNLRNQDQPKLVSQLILSRPSDVGQYFGGYLFLLNKFRANIKVYRCF